MLSVIDDFLLRKAFQPVADAVMNRFQRSPFWLGMLCGGIGLLCALAAVALLPQLRSCRIGPGSIISSRGTCS